MYSQASPLRDIALEFSKGSIPGHSTVNKFGLTTNADNGIATDVYDRANSTDAQNIWIAPTQARIHAIVSTDANDTSGGSGARTIQACGLVNWNSVEVSEEITLNGVTPVNTINSFVIIHRMKVLTKGATSSNIGVITATAATDGTVTAQINANLGQTEMAILGVPTIQKAYITGYYATAIKAASSLNASITLLVNPEPDVELLNFLIKHRDGIETVGSNYIPQVFNPYFKVEGPAIIKIQVNANANNTTVSGGFDLILVNN